MKTRSLLLAVVAIALAAGGAWWWQQAGGQQAVVSEALPPVPDLSAVPAVLRERVNAADARARSRLSAAKGLAELSRLYHSNGFLAEAIRCYVGLEQLAAAEPRWKHLHATILAGYGEIEPAVELWRTVLTLDPHYVPARLRLGDCELKANHANEAAAAYSEVLRQSPTDAYALLGLARIDLEASRWDQARQRLEAVVRQTNFNLGYDLIVSLYERLGLHAQASAIRGSAKASGAFRDPPDPWLDELLDVCFDPFRLALSAGVSARIGDPATAIRLLHRALELAPDDVSNHFQLGLLHLAQGDTKSAREQFELCITLAPDFADGWAQLSALQAQAGEKSAAEKTLAKGLQACPNSPGLHLMRARNLRQAGVPGEAITEFQNSIRFRPNEPDAYIELGQTYIELGHEKEGIQKIREALEADPGEPMALGVLAFYNISTNNETEAQFWLTKVANQPRSDRNQVEQLKAAFQQQFGRAFQPSI